MNLSTQGEYVTQGVMQPKTHPLDSASFSLEADEEPESELEESSVFSGKHFGHFTQLRSELSSGISVREKT